MYYNCFIVVKKICDVDAIKEFIADSDVMEMLPIISKKDVPWVNCYNNGLAFKLKSQVNITYTSELLIEFFDAAGIEVYLFLLNPVSSKNNFYLPSTKPKIKIPKYLNLIK